MKFFKAEDFDLKNYFKESYGSVDFLIARAKKGEVSCQIHLGTAYSRGIEGFVEKDTEKAIGCLDRHSCPKLLHSFLGNARTWSIAGFHRRAT